MTILGPIIGDDGRPPITGFRGWLGPVDCILDPVTHLGIAVTYLGAQVTHTQ